MKCLSRNIVTLARVTLTLRSEYPRNEMTLYLGPPSSDFDADAIVVSAKGSSFRMCKQEENPFRNEKIRNEKLESGVFGNRVKLRKNPYIDYIPPQVSYSRVSETLTFLFHVVHATSLQILKGGVTGYTILSSHL